MALASATIQAADVLGIPASDVEGVATFYSQIFRQPVGRHVI
ncbi:NAD(P)H-dependent oxidoreductase subunit E, partial [Escherichia coli]